MKHFWNCKDWQAAIVLIGAAIITSVPGTVCCETWHVRIDGLGDAPTIAAAIDSSVSGDVVLVGPGTYEIDTPMVIKDGIVVTSEEGPFKTKLVPAQGQQPAHVFVCMGITMYTEISGFWIEGFVWGFSDQGAILVSEVENLYIRNNVLNRNGPSAIVIDTTFLSVVYIEYNTILNSTIYGLFGGGAIGIVNNNIIWDRAEGISRFNSLHCNCFMDIADAGQRDFENFQEFPQFCGTADNGNLLLQSDSPCAPGNTPIPIPDCGLVGALPVGCATTPARNATWGGIKALYR
jgi:hypothetical protein